MTPIANLNWNIESLRITSFLKGDFVNSSMESWLKQLTGNDPISVQKTSQLFQGLSPYNSGILRLGHNVNRIDLLLNSPAPHISLSIGMLSELDHLMQDSLFRYFGLDECPPSIRLAIGVVLFFPVKDYDEGTSYLQHKLKSVSNIEGTTDLLFRINRPCLSKTNKDTKLNRLMTWSIGQMQVYKIPLTIGLGNNMPQIENEPLKNEMICKLELDFNTVDSNHDMTSELQREFATELLSEAINVAEKGECGIN